MVKVRQGEREAEVRAREPEPSTRDCSPRDHRNYRGDTVAKTMSVASTISVIPTAHLGRPEIVGATRLEAVLEVALTADPRLGASDPRLVAGSGLGAAPTFDHERLGASGVTGLDPQHVRACMTLQRT